MEHTYHVDDNMIKKILHIFIDLNYYCLPHK